MVAMIPVNIYLELSRFPSNQKKKMANSGVESQRIMFLNKKREREKEDMEKQMQKVTSVFVKKSLLLFFSGNFCSLLLFVVALADARGGSQA
jgi:hypothetical protein